MPNRDDINWKGGSPALANVFGERFAISFQDQIINGKKKEHVWRCNLDGCELEFSASIEKIERRGYGCDCSGPILSEDRSRHILSELTGFTFRKVKNFDFLRNKEGNHLEIDCYCEELNWAVEDNGSIRTSKLLSDEEKKIKKDSDEIKMKVGPEHFALYFTIPLELDRGRLRLENFIKSKIIEKGFRGKIINEDVDWTKFPNKMTNKVKLSELVKKINQKQPHAKCLVANFDDRHDPLPWDCGVEAHPDQMCSYNNAKTVIDKGKRLPCRYCSNKIIIAIEEMHAHAKEKGGVCKTNELPDAGDSEVVFDCLVAEHNLFKCKASDVRNHPDRCWCEICEPPPRERTNITTQIVRILAGKHDHDVHGEYRRNDIKMPVTCRICNNSSNKYTYKEMKNKEGSVWCDECKVRDRYGL